jgi:CRP-like cAMP-binding protein/FixJ family two-component response regulator
MNKSILIIEDSEDIRENTAEFLSIAGYTTITAENGKAGMEKALKEKPSLIVCDIMMPELDGYGLLHLLQKNTETQHIPFVFLTAKTDHSDFRRGMEMGADDYLTKPFTQVELLTAIENRLKKVDIIQQEYAHTHQGLTSFISDAKSAGFLEDIKEHYDTHSFAKKQLLYQEGKRPRHLFYLVNGKVKGIKVHEDGKEYITNLYTAGDFIGYAALIEDINYDDTAVILEESEIMLIPREDFLKMIYSDPAISSKFIKLISQNVKDKEERLLSLAYSTLRKRVANAIISISEKFNKSEGNLIDMTREDMAHFVGTTTESLIRTITDFKNEGLVDVDSGKIRIINMNKLRNLLN